MHTFLLRIQESKSVSAPFWVVDGHHAYETNRGSKADMQELSKLAIVRRFSLGIKSAFAKEPRTDRLV